MKDSLKYFLIYLGVLLVSILLTFFLTRSHTIKNFKAQIVEVHDTLTIEKPVPVTEYVTSTIEVPIYVRDTILQTEYQTIYTKGDTVYLQLPRTTKVYTQKEPWYYAEVSGFQPSLDVLQFDSVTKVVPEYVSKYPTFDLNLFTDVGYSFLNKVPQFQFGIEAPFHFKSLTLSPRVYYNYQSKSDVIADLQVKYHLLH